VDRIDATGVKSAHLRHEFMHPSLTIVSGESITGTVIERPVNHKHGGIPMRPVPSPLPYPQSGAAARRGDRTPTNLRQVIALHLRRAGLAATLLLVGGLPSAPVSAQAVFPSPAELLQQALDSQWNLDVSAAANAQTRADADISLARARLLPRLSVAGTWTLNQDDVSAVVPTGPDPSSQDEIVFTRRNQLETVLSVEVPLLDLQNRASVQLASAQQAGTTTSADVVVENLAVSLLQAWFQAVVADAVIEQSEQAVASAEQTMPCERGGSGDKAPPTDGQGGRGGTC
jgi:hypothetical protein